MGRFSRDREWRTGVLRRGEMDEDGREGDVVVCLGFFSCERKWVGVRKEER